MLFVPAKGTEIAWKLVAFQLEIVQNALCPKQAAKHGSIGCVGTVPEYREKGIGLAMVAHATQILKEAGCDKSFIHYTALEKWYGRLGYETCMAFVLGEKA